MENGRWSSMTMKAPELDRREEVGFTIMLAGNGLQALDEMRRRHFDGVVTDCQMPWMNGIEFLNHSRVFWPDTPVVIVSGIQRDETELVTPRRAFAWIQKPYSADVLYHVLNEALRYTKEIRLLASCCGPPELESANLLIR